MTLITQNETRYFPKLVELTGNLDLLQGAGGRSCAIIAGSNAANPVVKVQETWFVGGDAFVRSVLIENLIIDGQGLGVTGILLENVVQCQIRNVTIKNCAVGIHLRNNNGFWSECNYLKHIRMENVKKGILFTTTGPNSNPAYQDEYPGDSAGFTTIDDVGIELVDNQSDAVGIQVGGTHLSGDVTSTPIKPYSSRIKANVWVGNNYGTGLKITNGEIGYAQAHLTVHKRYGPQDRIGIDLQNVHNSIGNRPIWHNQFSTFNKSTDAVDEKGFMLITSNIQNPIDQPPNIETDVKKKTF